MTKNDPPDRRGFLRQSAVALSALTLPLSACRPEDGGSGPPREGSGPAAGAGREGREDRELAGELLDALADAALPSEIGPEGRREAASSFRAWVDGFEPAAELNHDYGSQAVHYGPADPAPRWSSQLAALEVVARRREGAGFAELSAARRRDLIRRRVPEPGGDASDRGLPGNPAEADHVAVGLLAWFYGRPRAADLGYRAEIDRYTCRPLGESGERPARLSPEPATSSDRSGGERPRPDVRPDPAS